MILARILRSRRPCRGFDLPQIAQKRQVGLGRVGNGEGDVLAHGGDGDDGGVVVGGDGGVGAAVADVGRAGLFGALGQARHLPALDVQRVDGGVHLGGGHARGLGDAIGVAAQCALGLRFQARHVQGRIGRGVLAALEQAGQGVLEVLEGALHAQLGQDAENGDDEDEGGNEADEGFDDLAVHGISSGWVTLREGAAGGTLMLGIRGSNAAIRRRPASMVTRRIRLHKSTTGRP